MYVAVKGGDKAIAQAEAQVAEVRRGNPEIPELSVAQIEQQMSLAVDRVMTEGSLYDRELAALAIKQAQGDLVEAVFLVRAYRTTLPRLAHSEPIDTGRMTVRRRISATFKDLPGGQILGPTYDYSHRLLDFSLLAESEETSAETATEEIAPAHRSPEMPRVADLLMQEGLLEDERETDPATAIFDVARQPAKYPADRDQRLQTLARGDEGFLLALGYSIQRGYGGNHPFAGEIRHGDVAVEIDIPELGFTVDIGDITVTECQMINQFSGNKDMLPQFTRGYGLGFGHVERKTMAMALVDRALKARELEETADYPGQDEEFVLSHCDNVEASGFVTHLKLPHYVDFQSELELIRRLRKEAKAVATEAAE